MVTYKGYIGLFEFDEKTSFFYGKVSNSHYPLTFQGKSIESTKESFKDAVDDYLEWCKKYDKEPKKPLIEE